MNKSRILLQASLYRKFLFRSQKDLEDYMRSGHQERWLVEWETAPEGTIVATVGERYNNNWKLLMEVNHGE